MVESADQARRIVESAKYPPDGRRGAAFGVAHDDYVPGDMAAKIRSANAEQLLIAQVETVRGLENVEAIAAVEGIDVLWVGQADLTTSLGIPGQYDHPRFLEAIDRVVKACRAHRKAFGYLALSLDDGKSMLGRGCTMMAYGGDLWLFQQTLKQGLDTLRGSRG